MSKNLVTVIIPVFNCEPTIRSSIESITTQTYNNLEIIVVDDHCTDNTASIVKKMCELDKRLKLIKSDVFDPNRFNKRLNRNINTGYSARNAGLKYATGKYITFQDADDISLSNRIEEQVKLLEKYNATHITTDWFMLNESFIGKKLDINKFVNERGLDFIGPQQLFDMAQKNKGLLVKILGSFHRFIPFSIKRMKIVNHIFFGNVQSYPGVTGVPLFKREVIDKVRFRPLEERIWPSFMGRGADRDFSFQVAETFKNSYVFFIPFYMWRVKNGNPKYESIINNYISK